MLKRFTTGSKSRGATMFYQAMDDVILEFLNVHSSDEP